LIIAHHPIVFKGMKKFSGNDYVSRTLRAAIKNDIAIYAIHTNLDNSRFGVNREIGNRLGLKDLKVLAPKNGVLNKLVCYVPKDHLENVREALFSAGAGSIGGYVECSFVTSGEGTYKPTEGTDPYEGKVGERSTADEVKLEVLVSVHQLTKVLKAMFSAHPYEEVAYEVYPILNSNQYEGSGMIGELSEAMKEEDFLHKLKETFSCGMIRHTNLLEKRIKKVAFCGGAGSFLLKEAVRNGADIFITGDFKYHEFFDADNSIVIADIGHFESEQFTSNLLADYLIKKFPKFAVHLTAVNTNPINYF
jgi:dinuclear metal center YbgI/SA1388 family protein